MNETNSRLDVTGTSAASKGIKDGSESMTLMFNTRKAKMEPLRDLMRGFSSVFNLSGDTNREYNKASGDADVIALGNDWKAVGSDLSSALDNYRLRV